MKKPNKALYSDVPNLAPVSADIQPIIAGGGRTTRLAHTRPARKKSVRSWDGRQASEQEMKVLGSEYGNKSVVDEILSPSFPSTFCSICPRTVSPFLHTKLSTKDLIPCFLTEADL